MRRIINEDYQPATLDRDVRTMEGSKKVGEMSARSDLDDSYEDELYEREVEQE